MIFILDDEPSICESTKFLLEVFGFQVKDYTSANLFLSEIKPVDNSCLLLDLSMPEMHGFQVKEELVKRQLKLPVIYTSAHCDPDSIQRVRNEGDCFLLKPYTTEDLLDCIHKFVQVPA